MEKPGHTAFGARGANYENLGDIPSDTNAFEPTNSSPKEDENAELKVRKDYKRRRTGRHGARNQHRHKEFAKWLLTKFSSLLSPGSTVLDVAGGGRGELAARLCFCHHLCVTIVDPRPTAIGNTFETLVLPKLPNKWQKRIRAKQLESENTFIESVAKERVQQLTMMMDTDTLETSEELQSAIQESSFLLGMHADGATEAVVDAALQHNKPFCVVPCCVFPSLFSERRICDEDGVERQVRSHEQFCQYLHQKDERFRMEVISTFPGRNVAIWWDGT